MVEKRVDGVCMCARMCVWGDTSAPCIALHKVCVRRVLADNCRKPFILRAVQTAPVPRRSAFYIPNTHLLALALKQLHAATEIPLVCYIRRGIPAPCVWDLCYPQCNVLSYKNSFVFMISATWLSACSCFELFSRKTQPLICLWLVNAWFKYMSKL